MQNDYIDLLYNKDHDEKCLMDLLWKLNFQDNDRMTTFREIEIYFLKSNPRLSKVTLSKKFLII